MRISRISDCTRLDLPKIHTASGDITAINNLELIPFKIKRVYYLYDIPNRADRGAHAHKELYQLVVAISGSFDIELFDGIDKIKFTLNQPDQGLLIVPGIWRDLNNFSGGGICLVLASHEYDQEDYIWDACKYLKWKSENICTMKKNEILMIVLSVLEQLNETFSEDFKFNVNENTVLFGNGSCIDSLSLVSVIVDLEMLFSDDHGFDISLTDDRAMTREISPFDSVTSLVDYICEVINEKQKD